MKGSVKVFPLNNGSPKFWTGRVSRRGGTGQVGERFSFRLFLDELAVLSPVSPWMMRIRCVVVVSKTETKQPNVLCCLFPLLMRWCATFMANLEVGRYVPY